MRKVIIAVFLLASFVAQAQDTPYVKPVTFTSMASNYWFKQQLKTDSLLQARKAIFRDSVGFLGVTTVPTALDADSNRKAANTEWVKKRLAAYSSNSCRSPLLSGGIVTWSNGLTFDVTTAYLCVLNNGYVARQDSVVLDPSDPSLPRQDLIVADTFGLIYSITGTPNVDPAEPSYDPSYQVRLVSVNIAAGATIPTGVGVAVIWDENTGAPEYTGTSSGLTVNFNGTTNPFHLTKTTDIGAWTTADKVSYTGGVYSITDYSALKFFIRLKASVSNSANISVTLLSTTGAAIAADIVLSANEGFAKNITNAYQNISIPFDAFSFFGSQTQIGGIKFTFTGSNGSGAYIDYITLQKSLANGTVYGRVYRIAGTDSVMQLVNGVPQFAFKDSLGSGGGGSTGISSLGTGYGLITVNDSTYRVDSTVMVNIARLNNHLAEYLKLTDTAAMVQSYKDSIIAHNTRLIGKQPLLTAGTNITIVGSTISASGGGGGSTNVYAPLVKSGDSISTRFNVRAYGATGDSTQDATPFIQAAINACFAAGGGTVYFPNGIYTLSSPLVTSENGVNPNSQLYLPPNYATKARTHINFEGETKPNFLPASLYVDTTYTRAGVILKSTITGSGDAPSVFGGRGDGAPIGFTYHFASFKNITLLVKANAGGTGPTMSGINAQRWASVMVDNCVIGIDTSLFRDTIPQNEVAGILFPLGASETMSEVRSTIVYGMRYGYFVSEHTVLDNAQAWGNYAGFVFQKSGSVGGHPISAYKIMSHWNVIDVLIPNTTIFNVTPNIVSFNIGLLTVETYDQGPRWFNNVYTVKDSLNYGRGNLTYKVQPSGAGLAGNTVYNQLNGTSVQGILYSDIITTSSRATGVTDLSQSSLTSQLYVRSPSSTGSPGIRFYKSLSSYKYGLGVDFNANGRSNFFIYDNTAAEAKIFIDSSAVNIGGVASAASTSAISINTSKDVSFNNGTMAFTAGTGKLTVNSTTDDGVSSIGSGTGRSGFYGRGTSASGQANLYLENNRGSFAAYGGMVVGGQSKANSFFGKTLADKLFIIGDGANLLGMGIGTLTADDLFFGTNNVERLTILSGGSIGTGVTAPTSTLHTTSFATAYTSKTGPYTATIADHTINGDGTSLSFTVTLPTAVGITGRMYTVRKSDSGGNAIIVGTTSSQTINGSTTYSLATQYKYVTVQSDGANWMVIANN